VLAVRQNIDAIAGPSPQIEALRAEAAELERGIVMRGGSVQGHSRESAGAAPRDRGEISAIPRVLVDDDPQLEYERGQLRLLFNKYNALRERIDGARVELDTAQAAFKYRYSVITPPQMPRRPLKPNSLVVLAASVLGGVFFALFAAALLDLRSGRLLEGWQLERRTGLRVLAEIRQ